MEKPMLTVLMPCLNEAQTVQTCIRRAQQLFAEHGVVGEVLIADNGSTDGSQDLARAVGARVVSVTEPGYGAAYMGGLSEVRSDIVLMGDADDSYRFDEAWPMVEAIQKGADVVIGNRFAGGIMPGAMPWQNRYIGNPSLSLLARILFRLPVRDFHCGMRAARTEKLRALPLVTTGMEWATEEVVKAAFAKLRIVEVPVKLYPDGRNRPPHLRRWHDGMRHMRFMLLHAPNWLFTLPGIALTLFGMLLGGLVYAHPFSIGTITLDVHTLLVAAMLVLMGLQVIYSGGLAKVYGRSVGLLPVPTKVLPPRSFERLLLGSILAMISGFGFLLLVFLDWQTSGFQGLDVSLTMRQFIPGVTLIIAGMQAFFASFLYGVLTVPHSRK